MRSCATGRQERTPPRSRLSCEGYASSCPASHHATPSTDKPACQPRHWRSFASYCRCIGAVKLQRRVHFEGCGGLKLTPLMRNAIAFQASLLVASRDLSPYRGLRSVLVYPEQFVVPVQHEDEAGVITQGKQVLSGQAEDAGRVLISWADVQEGIRAQDGYNVVLHEFAHLLDPVLGGELAQGSGSAVSWHEIMSAEYRALREALQAGEKPLIDPYGAEDPAEFFAVCTETFFEQPQLLKAQHPRLYATLKDFYGADPADWPTQTQAVREGSFTR